jgi:hypothetical protein
VRDQLFAEALVRYRRGEPWWPTPEFEAKHMAPEQETRFEADPWEEPIAEHLARKPNFNEAHPHGRVTVFGLAKDALGFDRQKIGTADQRRITRNPRSAGLAPRREGSRDPVVGCADMTDSASETDHKWFLANPGRRCRIRPRLPGEMPLVEHGTTRMSSSFSCAPGSAGAFSSNCAVSSRAPMRRLSRWPWQRSSKTRNYGVLSRTAATKSTATHDAEASLPRAEQMKRL